MTTFDDWFDDWSCGDAGAVSPLVKARMRIAFLAGDDAGNRDCAELVEACERYRNWSDPVNRGRMVDALKAVKEKSE